MTDDSLRPRGSARRDAAAARGDRRRLVLLAATTAVLLALIGVVAWQGARYDAVRTTEAARQQLRADAGPTVSQVLSSPGGSRDTDRSRVRALVTDDFALRTGLDRAAAPVSDQTMKWTTADVAIVDADTHTGTVLVDGDRTTTPAGRSTATPQTVRAVFVRADDDRWLLDQIDVVR